jgi:hypothetical protein
MGMKLGPLIPRKWKKRKREKSERSLEKIIERGASYSHSSPNVIRKIALMK